MSISAKLFIVTSLVCLSVWIIKFPQASIAPGKLSQGHADLEANCLTCHSPFHGASSERCMNCHKPIEIGQVTTKGQRITHPIATTPFHHKLTKHDCMACHSDHAGVQRLQPQLHFNHGLLETGIREQCQDCHKTPTDSLHENVSGACGQCHSFNKWVPATFDHDKYFVLDSSHNTRCITCHVGNDFKKYTCYGCHEHSPARIRAEHLEEGIRNFDNCVECHKSSNSHEADDD